jgi:hypothetical protein
MVLWEIFHSNCLVVIKNDKWMSNGTEVYLPIEVNLPHKQQDTS